MDARPGEPMTHSVHRVVEWRANGGTVELHMSPKEPRSMADDVSDYTSRAKVSLDLD